MKTVINSPRLSELKKRRKKDLLNKVLLCLAAFVVVFFLLAYLARLPSINIASMEVSGNKVIDTESIDAVLETETAGKYFWLFPKTNILIYPKSKIKKELADKFKRLGQIDISLDKKILHVAVTERVALYTWCGQTPPENLKKEECYFMDKDGFIFDEAPYFSGDVYFKFYGESAVGEYFAKDNFQKFIPFKDALKMMGLKVLALYVESDGNNRILLSAKNPNTKKPEVIFKIDADLTKIAENLDTALSTDPLKSEFKNNYAGLEYIDLRFGNKVYYKFND